MSVTCIWYRNVKIFVYCFTKFYSICRIIRRIGYVFYDYLIKRFLSFSCARYFLCNNTYLARDLCSLCNVYLLYFYVFLPQTALKSQCNNNDFFIFLLQISRVDSHCRCRRTCCEYKQFLVLNSLCFRNENSFIA